MTYLMKGSTDWLIEWLKQVFILPTDSRINWLTFWLTITNMGLLIRGLPDWLTDWLTNISTGLLIQGSTDWLIEWLIQVLAYWFKDQLTDWLIDYHKYWPTDSRVDWLIDWLTNASIGLLIQGSNDWLID